MQQINNGETNGIVIGPEFSRIFAELILQSIDRDIENRLSDSKLENRIDYQIFRYVDDYFIFFNDKYKKDLILEKFHLSLKEYKLCLNSSKEFIYKKPIITELSIAKRRISLLLNEKLVYKTNDELCKKNFLMDSIYISSNELIIDFKSIIKECKVEYKDIINYSLAIVEAQCKKIIENYLEKFKIQPEKQITFCIYEILKFVFFIYSAFPRVSTTIRLSRILNIFISYLKRGTINKNSKDLIFKYIHDNICFVLDKNKHNESAQVETIYLLIVLSELGKDYCLEKLVLTRYFDIEASISDKKNLPDLNYFSIITILFYIKNNKQYTDLRKLIEAVILRKYKLYKGKPELSEILAKQSELTMLLFDTLSCPYISEGTKTELLEIYGISNELHGDIINRKFEPNAPKKQPYFTKWNCFNFRKELDRKKVHEVY